MNLPFDEPENLAVFTCAHILEHGDEIRYATHDEEDGAWQFLCGKPHTEADARIVSLKEMFRLDPSIGALSTMPCGCGAVRDGQSFPWRGFRK